MKISSLAFVLLNFVVAQVASSQDIYFSQYDRVPLSLNPALTGNMTNDYRLNINYRNQSSKILRGDDYTVNAISLERKFILKNGDAIGFGFSGWVDRAGEISFGTTQGRVLLSYQTIFGLKTKNQHTLSFGGDLGLVKSRMHHCQPRWDSQYFDLVDESTLLPMEYCLTSISPDLVWPDLSFGFNWSSLFSQDLTIHFGVAIHHAFQSRIKYFDLETYNMRRFVFHGGASKKVTEKVKIHPKLMFLTQGDTKQYILGTALELQLAKPRLQIGSYLKGGNEPVLGIKSDALINTVSLNYNSFQIGLSYDVPLNKADTRGTFSRAFELTTTFLFDVKKN